MISDEQIEIPINPETQETDGVAFIQMQNESQAREGAAIFDGFKLTSKNIFATCLMPEFEKIMQTEDNFIMPQAAELEDLRAPIFDVKREQYFFKSVKNAQVNYFDPASSVKKEKAETLLKMENASDKPVTGHPITTFRSFGASLGRD